MDLPLWPAHRHVITRRRLPAEAHADDVRSHRPQVVRFGVERESLLLAKLREERRELLIRRHEMVFASRPGLRRWWTFDRRHRTIVGHRDVAVSIVIATFGFHV